MAKMEKDRKLSASQCEAIFAEQSIDTKRHVALILMELNAAPEKHPKWPTKTHEDKIGFVISSAIVAEESGELVRAALQFAFEKGQYYQMHREAAQVGAMAIRFLNHAPEIPFRYKSGKGGKRG